MTTEQLNKRLHLLLQLKITKAYYTKELQKKTTSLKLQISQVAL